MERARKILGTICLIASSLFMMAAFQNCAVYKSGDKSNFESSSVQLASGTGAAQKSSAKSTGTPCAGFIDEASADAAFGIPTELTSVDVLSENAALGRAVGAALAGESPESLAQPGANALAPAAGSASACMISAMDDGNGGTETAVCSQSIANNAVLQTLSENESAIIADPNAEGTMPEGSFGSILSASGSSAELVFVGRQSTSQNAIVCRFVFSTRQKASEGAAVAAARGSKLVRAIASAESKPL